MFPESDHGSVPADGDVVEYDGGFVTPEAPIVPVAGGSGDAPLPATRRVLEAGAERMGRDVHWLTLPAGEGARERHGDALPPGTVRALRRFRVGLVGPLAATERAARDLEDGLRRQVGLTVAADERSRLPWVPSPLHTGSDVDVDVTVFRDVSEDAAAGIEYGPKTPETGDLREFLLGTAENPDRVPDGPAGYGIRPISSGATESLVDAAMDYALDRDRRTLTVVHQGNLLPASEGSFRTWAREYLDEEYGDAIVDESTFRDEYGGQYPEDELVVTERRTDRVCRDLLLNPGEYDVLVAPALGGAYVSSVAAAGAGGVGVSPGIALGDGRLLAFSRPTFEGPADAASTNPIGPVLSGCLLFEYIGWADAASAIRGAVSGALADGVLPRDLSRRSVRGNPATADEFAAAVVERLDDPRREAGSGSVRTTADERTEIKRIIAGLYNTVFDDRISPHDIELNQLMGSDEEADVYLPEVGLNFTYWRRWSTERRLEVLLHELAHVEEDEGERDHGPEFYDRLVELTEIAIDWEPELEALFGTPIDPDRLRRLIVESVHEETIEPDLETEQERRRELRERFGLDGSDHY